MNLYYAIPVNTANGKYLYDAKENRIVSIPDNIYQMLLFDSFTDELQTEFEQYARNHSIRNVLSDPGDIDIDHHWTGDEIKENIDCHRKLLILSITNKCNMNCTYCIYHSKFNQEENINHSMSLETAQKAIDQLLALSDNTDTVHIGFYGGESLIEIDFIRKCVDYSLAHSNAIPITYGLTTNGLLLKDEEIRRFFEEYDFSIVVSLDGPREINDRYRVDKQDHGVYDRVIKNLTDWYAESPGYMKDNVSINAVEALPIPTKALDDFFSEFPIRYQFGEMLETDYFREHVCNASNAYRDKVIESKDQEFSEKYREDLITSFKNYVANGKGELTGNIIPGGPCIPVYLRWYVNSKGDYYPCERIDESEEFRIGNVDTGVDYDRIVKLYDDYIAVASKKCKGCWAMRLCGRCFKNINEDCTELKERLARNMVYYIENIKDNKKAMKLIEEITYSY